MTEPSQTSSVDFGFQSIPKSQKADKVAQVFSDVASRYDLMNDLMSLGLHRIWKNHFINQARIRPHHRVLDIAGGTGDLEPLILKKLGDQPELYLLEINHAMLLEGRKRLTDAGHFHRIQFVEADAEQLPFPDHHFDRITLAFGLRNMTDKAQALRESHRVLKAGGSLHVMEFSKPKAFLKPFYDFYSFQMIPRMGQHIAGQKEHYQYLVESIRKHPDQETLKTLFEQAGFEKVSYENLNQGIVAIHSGYRL